MKLDQVTALDWDKNDGLLPAIVQDARSGQVLMLAYMNREALRVTLAEKRATFFSRSRNRLWTKGESSGHWLHVVDVEADCDQDTLLVLANPEGPTCHTGTRSCFGDDAEAEAAGLSFLMRLESVIAQRITDRSGGQLHSTALVGRSDAHRAEGRRGRRGSRARGSHAERMIG